MPFADNIKRRLRAASRKALNQMGREMVEYIRFLISVPVEYVGSEVIRSDPGEPPRREFSVLWRSIKHRIEDGGMSFDDLVVFTAYVIAVYLEFGTHNMEPRPFWEPAGQYFRQSGLRRRYKELVAQNLAESAPLYAGADDLGPATDIALPEDLM